MKTKSKIIIITMFILLLSLPISLVNKTVYAFYYPLPSVKESDLNDHRGDQVTGDDIVNTGLYLAGLGFTYSNVGTCTGFVTRTLMHLKVGLPLVSRNSNWNYCYTESGWNQPGYIYTAAWGPSGFKTQAEGMVSRGEAEYIGEIPFSKQTDNEYINSLGIQNGDLLVTPEQNGKSGHVAFAYIYNGLVKSLGAGSQIGISDLKSSQSNKEGDIYVYRLVKSTGNIKIDKTDEHGKALAGITFHVSGTNVDQDYITDNNGSIQIEGLSAGEYTVTETNVTYGLVINPTPVKINVVAGETVTYSVTNYYQTGRTRIHKVDSKEENPKGDAKLSGARYRLYAAENISQGSTLRYTTDQLVKEVTTGENGYSEWVENLPIGNYYWVEYNPSEGYLLNSEKIDVSIEYQGQSVDKANESECLSQEQKKYNRARVIKMDTSGDSSEKEIAVGAVIRLYLVSDPTQYYDATIREDGSAEFIDEEFKGKYPDEEYTIPYGVYNIKEIKGSEKDQDLHTQFYIQEYTLELTDNHRTETVIVADMGITPYIKVIKTDADNGETVEIAGAKFKIWDCQNNEFVTQMETPSGNMISEFETNDQGYFITPTYVQPGKYIIYETEAPKGYVLNEKWRLPENESDYGVEGKGGKLINLNKITIGIKDGEVFNPDEDVIYPVEMEDTQFKGKVEVNKTGEMIVGVSQTTKSAFDEAYELEQPKYEFKGLEGVEYTLKVKEDIMSPDGKHVNAPAGKEYKRTTDENGYAISDVLYCGVYEVTETKTPSGYITDTDIPDIKVVNDETQPIQTTSKDFKNIKQPTQIFVEKEMLNTEYKTDDEKIKVVIGLYTNQDIKNYNQTTTVIKKDTLLDVLSGEVEVGEKKQLASDVNLPEGTYYFKEIYVDYPYTIDDQNYEVIVKHNNTIDKVLKVYGPVIENTPKTVGKLTIVKLSTSCLVTAKDEPIVGGTLSKEEINELSSPILEWMKRNEIDEIKAVLTGEKQSSESSINNYNFKDYLLSEAVYAIYTDEACTKPLKYTENNEIVTVTTDEVGFGQIDMLPLGEYWLKEIKSPKYIYEDKTLEYNMDPDPTHIIIENTDANAIICRALWDDIPYGKVITKRDLFTGELVPNCVFKIEDKEGNEIVQATTDERGLFEMKLDWFKEGETYTYTEIEAPDIYDIDTTPHEFKIEFDEDGNIIKTEAQNIRKTREVIVRKLDAETGDPLQGCVFTIALIDEETGEQKVNALTGKPIYLVENATTNENGDFIIEKAPMGTYKFTEIKAPEGYELDEDLTGLVFTINNDSPETIIFEVTNTGDIAVVAIACLSLICVVGIVSVLKKNIKMSK